MSQAVQMDIARRDFGYPPRFTWIQGAILLVLVIWLYHSILFRLAIQWYDDPNYTHGFFVPAFSIFVFWRERYRLDTLSPKPSFWGIWLVVFALTLLIFGDLGAELFLARLSFVVLIAGLLWLFRGVAFLRAGIFPLAFLLLMIPIPSIIFDQISLPLQFLASRLTATILPWFGVPVLREGNIINLPLMSLEVAQACSGIRSLLSLVTLAGIYGYVIGATRLQRSVLIVAAVPIALLANVLRVVVTGLLAQYWGPDKAEGFFHLFSGLLIFMASLFMLFSVQRMLSWVSSGRAAVRASQP